MTLKKLLFTSAAVISTSLIFPLSSFAASDSTVITTVSGVVKDAQGHNDPGVNVTVICNGKDPQNTTTQNDGSYQVTFDLNQCFSGDTVSASGTKGSDSGGGSTTVQPGASSDNITLNFAVVNFSVPEFSTLLGTLAGGFALGTYMVLRKKNSGVQS
jgi:hypothetical protein